MVLKSNIWFCSIFKPYTASKYLNAGLISLRIAYGRFELKFQSKSFTDLTEMAIFVNSPPKDSHPYISTQKTNSLLIFRGIRDSMSIFRSDGCMTSRHWRFVSSTVFAPLHLISTHLVWSLGKNKVFWYTWPYHFIRVMNYSKIFHF